MMSRVRKYAPRLIICVVLVGLIYGAMGIWIPYPPLQNNLPHSLRSSPKWGFFESREVIYTLARPA